MATAPTSATIRTYHVGFGDCFLISFEYRRKSERHVLIDFGSTGVPKGVPKSRMMDIAANIKQRTGGKLHAVVATHRHRDHISGFATGKAGQATGDVIKSLKPDLIVQPWTEDPKLGPEATGPSGSNANNKKFGAGTSKQVAALSLMHEVAHQSLAAGNLPKDLRPEIGFLGESNIANPSAVKNLMKMARNAYVYCGSKSGLEKVLPGVKVEVLGPPTLKQTDAIKKKRSRDPDEFWHFQVGATALAARAEKERTTLFPRYVESRGLSYRINARWLINHARTVRGEQLLQIVRSLDQEMNNTSVILLFQIGRKKLVRELQHESDLFTTQLLKGKDFFHDTVVTF
jgi:hypothetical protein